MLREVIVRKDHEAASRAVADLLLDRVAAHPAMEFHLGLSGGSTPRRLFELLAGEPYRSLMPWGDLRFWFADERAAPSDSPLSNFRLAEERLFAPLEIPRRHILRIPAHRGAAEAAEVYHELLEDRFGRLPDARGLDLVLLGMGPDGHVASLFPGHPALERPASAEAWALAVDRRDAPVPFSPFVDRVSLSLAALNASACAVFLVSGEEKAPALRRILAMDGAGSGEPEIPVSASVALLPAARVRAPETFWVVDRAASGG